MVQLNLTQEINLREIGGRYPNIFYLCKGITYREGVHIRRDGEEGVAAAVEGRCTRLKNVDYRITVNQSFHHFYLT